MDAVLGSTSTGLLSGFGDRLGPKFSEPGGVQGVNGGQVTGRLVDGASGG